MNAPRSGCPINLTLEALGDRWSLIVIRDLMFGNRRHFRELLTRSEERIASNLLANFNPSQGSVVAVRVSPDGTAGTSRTHAAGVFCDDFAFDVNGNLYCGTDPFNTVVRIASDGTMETILAAVDGLDGPTAVLFGRKDEGFDLYITNAAFPFFQVPPPRLPSLLRLQLDVHGFPQP